MKKPDLDLYSDYLLSSFGSATATGLSAMVEGDVSHDQITRFLSAQDYTSKHLWQQVKSTIRSVERDDGVLIFDDTIQEKAWTDESELMCWHFDHCSGRTVKGINLLNALYYCNGTAIPVAFELVKKPIQYSDIATRKLKRKSDKTKNEMMREMIETCPFAASPLRRPLTSNVSLHHDRHTQRYSRVNSRMGNKRLCSHYPLMTYIEGIGVTVARGG